MYFDPNRPPLLFGYRSNPATPRRTTYLGPPVLRPPDEHARAASPQPHRCTECAELRRQVEDLRRENELLQVELEVARMARDQAKVHEFLAVMKQKKADENIATQSPAHPVGSRKPAAVQSLIKGPSPSAAPQSNFPASPQQLGSVDLSQISFAEISELRQLRRPPQPVAKTLEALAKTLNYSSSEELLADASLISKLKAFAEKVDANAKVAIWKRIHKTIGDLTVERVQKCSHPAGLLFAWLLQTIRPN